MRLFRSLVGRLTFLIQAFPIQSWRPKHTIKVSSCRPSADITTNEPSAQEDPVKSKFCEPSVQKISEPY
jgi:hypothetical protein